ncbi:hypothetical protein [Oryzibacter oryziterrae]|uniref:hypothetical protein n=1 Tax=Oryzibacter oryziterrae TaxID=2766474 RepID=UPI001F1F7B86|nr:hypothetical protein [Oryzibacter oryziterrae]
MSKTADRDALDMFHEALAEELALRIEDGRITSTDLAVAAKFLKDYRVGRGANRRPT